MKTRINNSEYIDPVPERINSGRWHDLFKEIPEEFVNSYRYYRSAGETDWNTYLFPPSSFLIYGSRYLRKLKFDNSLASLRLWGFMLSESERLFRARQTGKKIVANMGDLGAIPPLVYSFENAVPFYPDCYWWTPFLNESTVLFDESKRLGIGENCCFVRAALGAFSKLAYFPAPDLNIGAAGASCDDMAGVMQLIDRLGHKINWFEIPHRRDYRPYLRKNKFSQTLSHSVEYQTHIKDFLKKEFESLIPLLEKTTGEKFSEEKLKKSIKKTNVLRKQIADIKHLTFTAPASPLPALEVMNIEFMALAGYSDPEEAVDILKHLKNLIKERIELSESHISQDAVRIIWVTPPADPLLLNYMEDLGGRLVGTEFVINQALFPLDTVDGSMDALADGMLNGSLMGSSGARAEEIINQAEKYSAEGIIVSNIFASSHCATETFIIKEKIRDRLNLPVLVFDVVEPGKKQNQSQILNRMAAFFELLKERRKKLL